MEQFTGDYDLTAGQERRCPRLGWAYSVFVNGGLVILGRWFVYLVAGQLQHNCNGTGLVEAITGGGFLQGRGVR